MYRAQKVMKVFKNAIKTNDSRIWNKNRVVVLNSDGSKKEVSKHKIENINVGKKSKSSPTDDAMRSIGLHRISAYLDIHVIS